MKATVVFQKTWEAINTKCHVCDGVKAKTTCTWCGDSGKEYRYIINSGSSRSSKTHSIIQLFWLYALQNPKTKLSAFRDTKKMCKDTIFFDMNMIYPDMPMRSDVVLNLSDSTFKFPNSSSIYIEGTDDPVKIHGYHSDILWFNEGYNIQRETFDQLDMRCSTHVIIDLNPRMTHWSDDLTKNPRSIVIHSTFKDNPFCPPEQRNKILSYQPVAACELVESGSIHETDAMLYDLAGNPNNYPTKLLNELIRCRENEAKRSANAFNWSVYGLGEKAERPNRIFSWDECSIEEYRAINVPVYVGVDWGKVDPWGIVECKYLDGTLYVHELNYESENEIRAHLTPTEQAQISGDEDGMVSWMFGKLGVGKSVPVIADNNRLLKIAALRRHGYTAFPASKPAGSVNDGIDLLHNLHVIFTSSSENIRYEQENYSWKVDNHGVTLDEPEDLNNHTIDPIRYVALYLQSRGIVRRM